MSGPMTARELNLSWATPTPAKQAAFVSLALGGAGMATKPGLFVRGLQSAAKAVASYTVLGPALPALGPDYKLGVRWGGTGDVRPLSQVWPHTARYGYASRYVLVPDFGFGLTAVPNESSRFIFEGKRSESSSHVTRVERIRRGGRPPMVPTRPTKSTRQRRRRKPARRLRAKKWCRRHKRYDNCR